MNARHRTPLALLIAAAVSLAACASAAPSGDKAGGDGSRRACFRAEDVNSWTAVDRDTVNLRVGVSDYYQLELLGPCNDIDWNLSIGLESRGSNWICSGLDATIISPSQASSGPPMRCPVRSIRKMSKEEVQALRGTGDKP